MPRCGMGRMGRRCWQLVPTKVNCLCHYITLNQHQLQPQPLAGAKSECGWLPIQPTRIVIAVQQSDSLFDLVVVPDNANQDMLASRPVLSLLWLRTLSTTRLDRDP